MATSLPPVNLPSNKWVDLYLETGITPGAQIIIQNTGSSEVSLVESASKPNSTSDVDSSLPTRDFVTNNAGNIGAWAISNSGGKIQVDIKSGFSPYTSGGFPDGSFSGLRALTTQSYTEANSKSGVEHEGSTLLPAVAAGASNDTFLVTGALPVALKGRIISYTGDGVTAEIFTGATYTGGASVPYQNASDINPVTGLTQIIVGATSTGDGTIAFAPNYLIGNTSNQGQGETAAIVGREKLLKPNTIYLLRITSLDAAAQDISSLLSWYEGELDLPLP